MKAPRRRERDETRVFKKMGEALNTTHIGINPPDPNQPLSVEAAEIKFDSTDRYPSPRPVRVKDGNSRNIMNYGQKIDSEGYTDQVREYLAATDEKATADANDKKRKKGKTRVVRIDSGN
jgi:hypothetical protein